MTGGMAGRKAGEEGREKDLPESDALSQAPEPRHATWRDRAYGKLKVSVRTMDLIIIGLIAALAAVMLLGVVTAGR